MTTSFHIIIKIPSVLISYFKTTFCKISRNIPQNYKKLEVNSTIIEINEEMENHNYKRTKGYLFLLINMKQDPMRTAKVKDS